MAVGPNITMTPEQRMAAIEGHAGFGEQQTLSADGAISLKQGVAMISKGSAAAITLAAPTTGTDDGKVLTIQPSTAFAHVVTVTSMRGGTTLTFGATTGDFAVLRAMGGFWYVMQMKNVTLA